ncbi:MAG: hypothetical protein RR058_00200 [Oscillospiraceae bacterium]
MKKIYIILTVLLCLCALVSCGGKAEDKNGGEILQTPSADGPIYEGSNVEGSPFVGKFSNTYSALYASMASEAYPEGGIPHIECRADGTFSLFINPNTSAEFCGLVEISGKFSVDGETAEFLIEKRGDGEYLGNDVTAFKMKLINENELRYYGDQIGCVHKNDIFGDRQA